MTTQSVNPTKPKPERSSDIPSRNSSPHSQKVTSGPGQSAMMAKSTKTQPAQGLYSPQFSTATSLILNRMRSKTSSLDEALSQLPQGLLQPDKKTLENVRNRVVQSLNTTVAIPQSDQPDIQLAAEALASIAGSGLKVSDASKKRKWESLSKSISTAQDVASTPKRPQTENQANLLLSPGTSSQYSAYADQRSRNAAIKRCSICQRSISLTEDRTVTCAKCTATSHYHCVPSLKLGKDVKDVKYLCQTCTRQQKKSGRGHLYHSELTAEEVEGLRVNRLGQLPSEIVPPRTDQVGFEAGEVSSFARSEYFYSKTKPQLLNLLSFCDELKPQLLVDVLVSISKKHPGLPIFDSPDWASRFSDESTSSNPTNRLGDQTGHPLATSSKAKPRHKSLKKFLLETAGQVNSEEVLDLGEHDTLPPTWPKAGEGLYASLVPEVEDREFLADAKDDEAFSHFMVDSRGRQMNDVLAA